MLEPHWILLTPGRRICTATTSAQNFALINLAGDMYGRILTEVVSAYRQIEISEVFTFDRSQDSPIQNDQRRLIRCLLYTKQDHFKLFKVTGLY